MTHLRRCRRDCCCCCCCWRWRCFISFDGRSKQKERIRRAGRRRELVNFMESTVFLWRQSHTGKELSALASASPSVGARAAPSTGRKFGVVFSVVSLLKPYMLLSLFCSYFYSRVRDFISHSVGPSVGQSVCHTLHF